MSNILEFMNEDHHRLDRIFKEFQSIKNKDYNKAKNLFREFKISLQRHIIWEEDILFPLFDKQTEMQDSGPTAVMRMEHRQIKELLEEIHNKIIKKETRTNGEEKELVNLLTAHNEKEESILYPWIDNILEDKSREEVLTRMKNLPATKYNQCCSQ